MELGVLQSRIPPDMAPDEPVKFSCVRTTFSTMTKVRLARIERRQFRGAEFLYYLRLASGAKLLCLASSHHDHAVGPHIGVEIRMEHLVVFRRGVG
jgi:iron(III) transport system ATP-binding protein